MYFKEFDYITTKDKRVKLLQSHGKLYKMFNVRDILITFENGYQMEITDELPSSEKEVRENGYKVTLYTPHDVGATVRNLREEQVNLIYNDIAGKEKE